MFFHTLARFEVYILIVSHASNAYLVTFESYLFVNGAVTQEKNIFLSNVILDGSMTPFV